MIETTITSSPGIDTNTIVESTRDSGVEIKRIETQWARVVTPGYTLTAAVYQIASRVTIESDWEPFYYVDGASGATVRVLSTKLNSRRTRTELLIGTPCAVGYGSAWVQGGIFLEMAARLQNAELLVEWYTWNDDCTPKSSTVERSQSYSWLDSSTGFVYADGSIRNLSAYSSPLSIPNGITKVTRDVTYWPPDPYLFLPTAGVGNLTSERWYQDTPGHEVFGVVGPGVSGSVAVIAPIGATLQPARGSATIPQVFEEIVMAEFDATDATNTTGFGGYTKVTQSPGSMQYPENAGELISVAKRRVRKDLGPTYDINHNCIPFLRPGDHVALSSHKLSLLLADVYVLKTKRSAAVLNAAMRQVTTVRRPADWI
jgi:hypothetical protein